MIRIVNHGKFYKIAKCDKCECSFGYSINDLNDSISEDTVYVNCPECNNKIFDDGKLIDRFYKEDN
jgi:DNA-directed RNA polymerase subunit RPC12/RpoP